MPICVGSYVSWPTSVAGSATRFQVCFLKSHILAIGPMTRGDLWEVVAVPDIRSQVSALARRLVNAHWTGGEGL